MTTVDVVIIGAGIAGLTAARRLADAGMVVVVVDKGRGVGGRMATRRLASASFDHGAQFFTARSPWFVECVDRWIAAGAAREWCRGFRTPPDGHSRFVGTGGMTAVPKLLATSLPDVRLGTRVTSIDAVGDGWQLRFDGAPGAAVMARAVLVTSPAPQALELLAPVALAAAACAALERVAYSPTLALLVATDAPTSVPDPGGVQLDEGPLSWVGDNVAKGVSTAPAVTLHASPTESAARFDTPAADLVPWMLDAGRQFLGDGTVIESQLMRWRYAQPTASHDARFVVAVDGACPVVCAGDAFAEAKVEGAAHSGWEAAGALLDNLT